MMLPLPQHTAVESQSSAVRCQSGELSDILRGDQLLSFPDFAASAAFVFPSRHSAHSALLGARFVLEKSRHRMSARGVATNFTFITHRWKLREGRGKEFRKIRTWQLGIWEQKGRTHYVSEQVSSKINPKVYVGARDPLDFMLDVQEEAGSIAVIMRDSIEVGGCEIA